MKISLSKLSIALAAAGLCISTAGLAGISHKPVGVPSCGAQYRVGVTGYYLRVTDDSLLYASTEANGHTRSHVIEHDHDFSFGIHGAFMLNDSGNDLAANYTYLSSDDDDTTTSANGVNTLGFADFNNASSLTGESEFKFHEFNLEIGQLVDYCQLHTRFHFGLSYATIEHELSVKGSIRDEFAGTPYNSSVYSSSFDSKFSGLGPRAGVDMNYPINDCSNFSIVAHVTGSLLAGELERDGKSTRQDFVAGEGGVEADGPATLTSADVDDVYTVVPHIGVKAGVRYGNTQEPGQAGWAVEAGWHAAGYLQKISTQTASQATFSNAGFYLTFDYAG